MLAIRDRVRYVETDMMAVAHHSNYLHWFEMGRVAYLRACGVLMLDLLREDIVTPITEVKVKYRNSLLCDDEYEVQTTLSEFNRAKLDFTYKVIRLRDGAVAVEGFTRNMFTNGQGKILRLPPKWFEKIDAAFKAEQDRAVK